MVTILIFILVLLVTVTVHEWGHFIVAKKSGMFVEEFGVGIPPRLWSFKKGETVYTVNALPIGGFVKIAGENGTGQQTTEDGTVIPTHRQFQSKPWYLQAAVLVAGVVCNIILAFVLFVAAYTIGMPQTTPVAEGGVPTVVSVTSNSPAAKAGLVGGDTVQSVTVAGVTITDIDTEQLRDAITTSSGAITVAYTHKGQPKTTIVTPEGVGVERKIGLAIEPIKTVRLPIVQAAVQAALHIYIMVIGIWQTLAGLIVGLFTNSAVTEGLTGPVGLVREVGNAATIGFAYLLAFTAAISVNLAVLNIMPFPALDGGRLVVVLLEAITRRKFSAKTVGIIHAIGFAILLLLMVVLTVGDIRRLF